MKKIYAIYCVLELIDQSTWLKEFRARYDVDYPLHITLKQTAHVDESEFPKVRSTLDRILDEASFRSQNIQLVFDEVITEEHDIHDSKGYVYLFASKRNDCLDTLQKTIREQLAQYSNYFLKESRTYEYDFRPHITIGRGLSEEKLASAMIELPAEVACAGRVVNITLSFVQELSPQEASNPDNLTVYNCQLSGART